MPDRPDYGLDAPGVVRNLLLAGGLCLALWATAAARLWPGKLTLHLGGGEIVFVLAPMGLTAGLALTAVGFWMLWSSKVGKLRDRDALLAHATWRGDEEVLDVGCGRGLLLIGAAKRLTSGHATGIDLWRAEDLAGNRPEATLENARREGVAERVAVKTDDMRELPFDDGAFDVVVSRAAIHNLSSAAERAKAIAEVARVMKPGGVALIDDVRHPEEYAAAFTRAGCRAVERLDSRIGSAFTTIVTMGSLKPGVVRAVKPR